MKNVLADQCHLMTEESLGQEGWECTGVNVFPSFAEARAFVMEQAAEGEITEDLPDESFEAVVEGGNDCIRYRYSRPLNADEDKDNDQ